MSEKFNPLGNTLVPGGTRGGVNGQQLMDDVRGRRRKPVLLTKSGRDVFQTDEHGRQFFTFEGWKENEEASKEWMNIAGTALKHLWTGFRESPGGIAELGPNAIEAVLKGADGWLDIGKGVGRALVSPLRDKEEEEEAKYNNYLKITSKFFDAYGVYKDEAGEIVPFGTPGATEVVKPQSYLGDHFRRLSKNKMLGIEDPKWLKDLYSSMAVEADDIINPHWADSWSFVLDPSWLIPGGAAGKVSKLFKMGAPPEKMLKALQVLRNAKKTVGNIPGVSKAGSILGSTITRPTTTLAGGTGRVVSGAGKLAEQAGVKLGEGTALKAVGGVGVGAAVLQYSDRDIMDILVAGGAGWASAVALPKLIAKGGGMARVTGEAMTATAKGAEIGKLGLGTTFAAGEFSEKTQRALKLLDSTPMVNTAFRGAAQITDAMAKGSAFGAGMGYLVMGEEGAAAGMGIGVLGGPMGMAQGYGIQKLAGAKNRIQYRAKDEKGNIVIKEAESFLDIPEQDLVANWLAKMPESDREALPRSIVMSDDKMYGMALMDAWAMGLTRHGEGDLNIRYMSDKQIKATFPDETSWTGKEGIHHPNMDGKPLVVVNMSHAVDPLRTLAHELFHPDWSTGASGDSFKMVRGEIEGKLFGIKAADGSDAIPGMFNERQFLSLEGDYLSRLFKDDPVGRTEHENSPMQERRTYIMAEMLSEHFGNFAEAGKGDVVAHARKVLWRAGLDQKGDPSLIAKVLGMEFTKYQTALLGRMREAFEFIGVKFDAGGNPASAIFKDPRTAKGYKVNRDGSVEVKGLEGLRNTPEIDNLLAQYVLAKDRLLKRLGVDEKAVEDGGVVTAKEILSVKEPGTVEKFRNSGMFQLDGDGNVKYKDGMPVLLTREQRIERDQEVNMAIFKSLDSVARAEHVGEGLVRHENEAGDVSYSGRYMNKEQLEALMALPDEVLPKSMKKKIRDLNENLAKGFDEAGNLVGDPALNFLISYYKATTGSKYTSKARMAHQHSSPYGWAISQAGNFNLQTFSIGRFESKLNAWWKKAQKGNKRYENFFKLFDGDPDVFRAKVVEYLHNQVRGKHGLPDAQRTQKDAIADFLNALPKEQKDRMPLRLSTDKEHVVPISLRVDRMEEINTTIGTTMPVNYENLKINFKPAAPEKGGAKYMAAGEKKAGKDPYSELIYSNEKLPKGVTRDEQANLQYKGKQPKDWTPEEFETFGKKFGVKNLGPLSEIQTIKDKATGHTLRLPGGLGGKFTYYDLLWIKNNNPEVFPRTKSGKIISEGTHAKITDKLARTLTPPKGDKLETFNRMVFGMLSPNTPLLPNLFGQARTKFASIDDVKRMAKLAELLPDNPTQKQRKAVSDKIKKALGIGAADKGGLGIGITQDFTNVAEFARLWLKDSEWFNKKPDEGWSTYVDRVGTQLRGLGTKTASFGGVWQDPSRAMISAIDRHMARTFADRVLEKPEMRARFEAGIVRSFNKNLGNAKLRVKKYNSEVKTGWSINKKEGTRKRIWEKGDEAAKAKAIKKLTDDLETTMRDKGLPDPTMRNAKTLDDVIAQTQDVDPAIVSEWIGQAALDAMGARTPDYLTNLKNYELTYKGKDFSFTKVADLEKALMDTGDFPTKKSASDYRKKNQEIRVEKIINPKESKANRLVKFIKDPEKFKVMSDAYMEALKINEEKANEMGVAIFPAQWTLWDRVRGRIEPHEVMFPGFHKLPKMGPNQIRGVLMKQSKMGYATAPRAVEAGKTSPASMAYFMPAGSDASYMKAAKKGDTKGAQLLVDKAAKAAGYTIGPVYHGGKKDVTVFDPSKAGERFDSGRYGLDVTYFGSKKVAREYADIRGGMHEVYLKMENPYVIRDLREDWYNARMMGDGTAIENLKAAGYDGIYEPNALMKDEQGNKQPVYAVFSETPNQIKSADPITKDNKGNIIPLSERFNPKSDDIRYMPASGKVNSKQFKEWFKGSSIVGKDKNPLVVYHGSREGAGVIDEFKTPAFFSPDKMAADWYGDSRPYYLNIKNPAGYNDIIKAAKKAGVKDVGGEYPEVAKHSPYDGTNENDLVYIPKVREQLKSMGFDGYRAWDWLGNSEIDAIVAFDKSQIRYKSEKPNADKQLRLERDLKKKKRN